MDALTKEYKRLVRDSWKLFYLSHRAWSKAIEDLGLSTSAYSSLELIFQKPGITQQEISDALSIDKSCTSRACKQLDAHGFIRREKSPDCTHGYQCYPTDKAKETCERIIDIERIHIHTLFEDIDISKLKMSSSLLDSLIERLNSQ